MSNAPENAPQPEESEFISDQEKREFIDHLNERGREIENLSRAKFGKLGDDVRRNIVKLGGAVGVLGAVIVGASFLFGGKDKGEHGDKKPEKPAASSVLAKELETPKTKAKTKETESSKKEEPAKPPKSGDNAELAAKSEPEKKGAPKKETEPVSPKEAAEKSKKEAEEKIENFFKQIPQESADMLIKTKEQAVKESGAMPEDVNQKELKLSEVFKNIAAEFDEEKKNVVWFGDKNDEGKPVAYVLDLTALQDLKKIKEEFKERKQKALEHIMNTWVHDFKKAQVITRRGGRAAKNNIENLAKESQYLGNLKYGPLGELDRQEESRIKKYIEKNCPKVTKFSKLEKIKSAIEEKERMEK